MKEIIRKTIMTKVIRGCDWMDLERISTRIVIGSIERGVLRFEIWVL